MEGSRSQVPCMYKTGWQETHLLQTIHTDPRLWLEGFYELGSVHLSFHPAVFLSGSFLGSLVFSETQHCVRSMCCYTRQSWIFFKKFVPKNGANGPKIGVFEFFGKFSHKSFLNLIYKKSLYYLKYSCTNFILGKNLVHEIWTEMLLSNQIAGFLNCLYLQNKMMKKPGFLYVDTES